MLTSKGLATEGAYFRMEYSQWFKRVCSLRTDAKSSLRPAAQSMEGTGESHRTWQHPLRPGRDD